jgi:prepilin-type N-terminal cleavage/methylation domain-containing protein
MDNQNGFTLIELMTVIAIITILATIGMMYLGDARLRTYDAHALTEGRHLMTALSDAFLGDEDVYFGDGATELSGDIGTSTADESGTRKPIFTLSNDVRVILDGWNTAAPGDGYVMAYVWHVEGSRASGVTQNSAGKREYLFEIDEATGEIDAPSF